MQKTERERLRLRLRNAKLDDSGWADIRKMDESSYADLKGYRVSSCQEYDFYVYSDTRPAAMSLKKNGFIYYFYNEILTLADHIHGSTWKNKTIFIGLVKPSARLQKEIKTWLGRHYGAIRMCFELMHSKIEPIYFTEIIDINNMCGCKRDSGRYYADVKNIEGVVGKYVCEICKAEKLIYELPSGIEFGFNLANVYGLKVKIYNNVHPFGILSFEGKHGISYYSPHFEKPEFLRGDALEPSLEKKVIDWMKKNDDNICAAMCELDDNEWPATIS